MKARSWTAVIGAALVLGVGGYMLGHDTAHTGITSTAASSTAPSTTLSPASSAAPSTIPTPATAAAQPSPALSYDANGNIYPDPLCTAVGGTTAEDLNGAPICTQIPYLGPDDQTYYSTVPVNPDGTLQGPAQTEGTGATESECVSGYWPEYHGIGPTHAAPGKWSAALGLCQP